MRREHDRLHDAREEAKGPQLDDRPPELVRRREAADQVDVQLLQRRPDWIDPVEVVDDPEELDQVAVEALLDRERPGRAVENADAAEARVDAEVLVAGDDHDGGELLDPFDAARPAGEELVEPQV